MSDLWCEKDEHFWDDPEDLENTYCLQCDLSPVTAKAVHRLEAEVDNYKRERGIEWWLALDKAEAKNEFLLMYAKGLHEALMTDNDEIADEAWRALPDDLRALIEGEEG